MKVFRHISVGLLLVVLIGVVPAKLTAAAGGHATAGHLLNLFNGTAGTALFALPVMPEVAGVESGPGAASLASTFRQHSVEDRPFDARSPAAIHSNSGCPTHIMNRVLRI